MDWDIIAPMVVSIVLIVTVGGVLVLRPIAKRVSELLEYYARDRQVGMEGDVSRMRELMETMNARLQLLEERQDFMDRLLTSGESVPKSAGAEREG